MYVSTKLYKIFILFNLVFSFNQFVLLTVILFQFQQHVQLQIHSTSKRICTTSNELIFLNVFFSI